jgi:hypothetical protein
MTRTSGDVPEMSTFARLVESRFRLQVDHETSIEVELADFRQVSAPPSYEQFSLVFRAKTDATPEQRIYELDHETAGLFELFLVPIGRTEGGFLLEAIVNRRVEPGAGRD